jgi:hypothetical protein
VTSHRSELSVLRGAAVAVMLVTTAVILILPGSNGCPPRRPGELDPLECRPTVFTAPRLIVFGIGLAIAVTLWAVAVVRDPDA